MTLPLVNIAEICGYNKSPHMVSVRPYMQPGEMDIFVQLVARARPNVVVEFGVNEGITANELLLRFIDIERYIGIDVPPEYEISEQQRSEIPQQPGRLVADDPRFDLIIRRNGSLDLMPSDLPICDVAYIDGDHRYKAVMHDSQLAKRIVRPGGIIIWHDADNQACPDVRKTLEELHGEGWAIRQVDKTWLAFMQV